MYSWMPSRTKLVALLVPASILGKTYGVLSMLFNASRTTTPFIMGRLTWLGYGYLLLVAGSATLILSTTTYILLKIMIKVEKTNTSHRELLDSYKQLFTYFGWDALPLVLFVGLDGFAWRLWFPILNAYLKQYRGLGDPEIGNFMSLLGLSMLFTSYIAGIVTDKLKPRRSLVIYEFLGAFGIALLLMDYPILYGGAILFGFSIAFWVTAYNSLITIVYGYESIGRLRALTDTTRTIATIPAPQIGGYLLLVNPILPFIISMTTMITATLPISMVKVRGKPEKIEVEETILP